MEAFDAVKIAVRELDSKKAEDIRVIKTSAVTSLADYIIICTGSSTTKVKSLADYAEEALVNGGCKPLHREGYMSGNWVLLDCGEVIVHIFNRRSREFYALEEMWQGGEPIDISDLITED